MSSTGKSCPWCKGAALFDISSGEIFCGKCGKVIEQNVREGQFNPWYKNKYDRPGGKMGP